MFFLRSFRFTRKLRRRHTDFPYTPCPHKMLIGTRVGQWGSTPVHLRALSSLFNLLNEMRPTQDFFMQDVKRKYKKTISSPQSIPIDTLQCWLPFSNVKSMLSEFTDEGLEYQPCLTQRRGGILPCKEEKSCESKMVLQVRLFPPICLQPTFSMK